MLQAMRRRDVGIGTWFGVRVRLRWTAPLGWLWVGLGGGMAFGWPGVRAFLVGYALLVVLGIVARRHAIRRAGGELHEVSLRFLHVVVDWSGDVTRADAVRIGWAGPRGQALLGMVALAWIAGFGLDVARPHAVPLWVFLALAGPLFALVNLLPVPPLPGDAAWDVLGGPSARTGRMGRVVAWCARWQGVVVTMVVGLVIAWHHLALDVVRWRSHGFAASATLSEIALDRTMWTAAVMLAGAVVWRWVREALDVTVVGRGLVGGAAVLLGAFLGYALCVAAVTQHPYASVRGTSPDDGVGFIAERIFTFSEAFVRGDWLVVPLAFTLAVGIADRLEPLRRRSG